MGKFNMEFKTTTAILEFTQNLVVKASNNLDIMDMKKLNDDAENTISIINSHLESGAFVSEGRNELLNAKENAIVVINLYIEELRTKR